MSGAKPDVRLRRLRQWWRLCRWCPWEEEYHLAFRQDSPAEGGVSSVKGALKKMKDNLAFRDQAQQFSRSSSEREREERAMMIPADWEAELRLLQGELRDNRAAAAGGSKSSRSRKRGGAPSVGSPPGSTKKQKLEVKQKLEAAAPFSTWSESDVWQNLGRWLHRRETALPTAAPCAAWGCAKKRAPCGTPCGDEKKEQCGLHDGHGGNHVILKRPGEGEGGWQAELEEAGRILKEADCKLQVKVQQAGGQPRAGSVGRMLKDVPAKTLAVVWHFE